MRLKHSACASPRKCVIQSISVVQYIEMKQSLHHASESSSSKNSVQHGSNTEMKQHSHTEKWKWRSHWEHASIKLWHFTDIKNSGRSALPEIKKK